MVVVQSRIGETTAWPVLHFDAKLIRYVHEMQDAKVQKTIHTEPFKRTVYVLRNLQTLLSSPVIR